jgi:hypothetical protein
MPKSDNDNNSSTKKKRGRKPSSTSNTSKKSQHPTYLNMVYEAISSQSHFGHGASSASIRNYIKANYDGLADTGIFNANIRKALQKGLDDGYLEHGDTIQRFKLTDKGRKDRKQHGEPSNSLSSSSPQTRSKSKKQSSSSSSSSTKDKKK